MFLLNLFIHPSLASSYTDLNNEASQLTGHVLGSRHVEQMYNDLGLDWRKTLGRKGERMTT